MPFSRAVVISRSRVDVERLSLFRANAAAAMLGIELFEAIDKKLLLSTNGVPSVQHRNLVDAGILTQEEESDKEVRLCWHVVPFGELMFAPDQSILLTTLSLSGSLA